MPISRHAPFSAPKHSADYASSPATPPLRVERHDNFSNPKPTFSPLVGPTGFGGQLAVAPRAGKRYFDARMSTCPADVDSALVTCANPSSHRGDDDDDDDDEQYQFDYGDQNAHVDDARTHELIASDVHDTKATTSATRKYKQAAAMATGVGSEDTADGYGGVYNNPEPERGDVDTVSDCNDVVESELEAKRANIKQKSATLFAERQAMSERRISAFRQQNRQREQRSYYRAAVSDIIGADYTSRRSEEVNSVFSVVNFNA